MPLKVQNKLNFLYVISGGFLFFFYLFCSPSSPEHHVSIISSKFLIAPVCVRGWKPLSVLLLRNRRLSSIKPWISQDLWCIWEKKRYTIYPRAVWAAHLLSKQCCFLGEKKFTEQARELPQVHATGGFWQEPCSVPRMLHDDAFCFCPQPSPSKSYKATVAFESCG